MFPQTSLSVGTAIVIHAEYETTPFLLGGVTFPHWYTSHVPELRKYVFLVIKRVDDFGAEQSGWQLYLTDKGFLYVALHHVNKFLTKREQWKQNKRDFIS